MLKASLQTIVQLLLLLLAIFDAENSLLRPRSSETSIVFATGEAIQMINQTQRASANTSKPNETTDSSLIQRNSAESVSPKEEFSNHSTQQYPFNSSEESSVKSSFREQNQRQQQQQASGHERPQLMPGWVNLLPFRIGVIVPPRAFVSRGHKLYSQTIKDTLAQLRPKPQDDTPGASKKQAQSSGDATGGFSNAQYSIKPSTCRQDTIRSLFRQHRQQPWQDQLNSNQTIEYMFEIVGLNPRTAAQDVIESMCEKLIEKNVSVIIYLETEDETSNSLDNNLNKSASSSSPSSSSHLNSSSSDNDEQATEVEANRVRQASPQAHFIMHLAHSAGIPMIAWSVSATLAQRPKKHRTLHLAPTVAHEAEAMLAIMKRYSWYSFSVVRTTLAGHEDFILALRQLIVASNSLDEDGQQASSAYASEHSAPAKPAKFSSASATTTTSEPNKRAPSGSEPEISSQPTKIFKLLDVITIKKRTISHIEEEIRPLTVGESRVILLYASKDEAINILKVAKKLKLTKRGYVWIVAQSVVGPNENWLAPAEFHPGLLGIYFRSNEERLLDELSRAVAIIFHGMERFVRDKVAITSRINDGSRSNDAFADNGAAADASGGSQHLQSLTRRRRWTAAKQQQQPHQSNQVQLTDEFRQRLLGARSSCSGAPNGNGSPSVAERGDLLYEYFRRSSPSIVFDADGSLRDVMLNVVNLDNARRWRRIGCFSNAKLTIDDITWPGQAERPPSGTREKFHLRAVFLEEPSFVNLADPDLETGECKANRAVRCRYKIAHPLKTLAEANSAGSLQNQSITSAPGDSQASSSQRGSLVAARNETGDQFGYKCCSGFCIDLMEKLAAELKFSYDLYRVPDGLWGILENNTWSGLISEITKGHADIIVSSTKINSDRQKAVEFTVPFMDTGISILVAKQTDVISKLAFLEPFDTLAWVMFICVGIPLAATSIFYFEWLSPSGFYAKNAHILNVRSAHEKQNSSNSRRGRVPVMAHQQCCSNATQREGPNVDHHQMLATRRMSAEKRDGVLHKFSFCRTLWLVFTILFGSAAHIDSPKGYTARFMSNVWATFAVVFLAVYTANLAAFMITREEYLEFSGITDSRLAYPYYRHPPLQFGTLFGGNTHAVLSSNKPNLYNYMRRFNRPTVEDGVNAVKTGHLDAFVYDALVLDYIASQDPECKLVNVGSWYSMTGYALAFPKNSRYFDEFNMKMLEYRKNGELDRLRRFWFQRLCKPGQNRSISKPLDLSQFMSAFLLLGAGILCSVLILLLEHLYILYLRDRFIKSRHRLKLIEFLYPFSLSLADTLRLPGDGQLCDECTEHDFAGSEKQIEESDLERQLQQELPTLFLPPTGPTLIGGVSHSADKDTSKRARKEQKTSKIFQQHQSSTVAFEMNKLNPDSGRHSRRVAFKLDESTVNSHRQPNQLSTIELNDGNVATEGDARLSNDARPRPERSPPESAAILDTMEACENSIEKALLVLATTRPRDQKDERHFDELRRAKLLVSQARRKLQDFLATIELEQSTSLRARRAPLCSLQPSSSEIAATTAAGSSGQVGSTEGESSRILIRKAKRNSSASINKVGDDDHLRRQTCVADNNYSFTDDCNASMTSRSLATSCRLAAAFGCRYLTNFQQNQQHCSACMNDGSQCSPRHVDCCVCLARLATNTTTAAASATTSPLPATSVCCWRPWRQANHARYFKLERRKTKP